MTDDEARRIIAKAFVHLEGPSVPVERTKAPMTDEHARRILAKGFWDLERPSVPAERVEPEHPSNQVQALKPNLLAFVRLAGPKAKTRRKSKAGDESNVVVMPMHTSDHPDNALDRFVRRRERRKAAEGCQMIEEPEGCA
jgi:hypothetical protein